MTQPVSDLIFSIVVNGGATVTPFFRTPAPVAFGSSDMPPDDDLLFPYHPRTRNAGAFQFDILFVRHLPPNYAEGILDELGSPLRDTFGDAIFP